MLKWPFCLPLGSSQKPLYHPQEVLLSIAPLLDPSSDSNFTVGMEKLSLKKNKSQEVSWVCVKSRKARSEQG